MNISLSSILLFALVIPFIMTFSIYPDVNNYILFTCIFSGLLIFILLDILKLSASIYARLKSLILWFTIVIVLGSAFTTTIIIRHKISPVYQAHDIILQQESAIRYLLDGKNPYAETYFGTALESWNYSENDVNPALYHFVMQPFYLLFPLPFYVVSNIMIGYFDARIPLYFLFLMLLILGWKLISKNDQENRFLFLIFLAFNPAMLGYIWEGRSDIFMYAFMFGSLYLLQNNRLILAGIPMGLAFAIKQSAWPIFPFYVFYLFLKFKSIPKTLWALLPFFIIFLGIVMPFFLWNPQAFIDSTIYYLNGNIEHSYPVSGYGFGMLLHQIGFIPNLKSYYPFIIWQIIVGIPVFFFLSKYLSRNITVKKLVLVYGIFLFVYWYFSRYFNNSHLGFLSILLITSYFWPDGRSIERKNL